MALDFGRCPGSATVTIDRSRCTACGKCVEVCFGAPLTMDAGAVHIDPNRIFGCIGCGACVTVCPKNCITVFGRDLSSADIIDLPDPQHRATYASLASLMQARRSTRRFTDQPVDQADIDRILAAAATAPMGLPPSEVSVLVLSGHDKVQEFRRDLTVAMRPWRWFFSAPMLMLMRPFMSRDVYQSMKTFIGPAIDAYLGRTMGDADLFFYDAPLAMMFYGSPLVDYADPMIAATYAMLAAESLGLGTCMLGFPSHIAKSSSAVRRKYQLPKGFRPGVTLIVGHSAIRWQRAITRHFAGVHYH